MRKEPPLSVDLATMDRGEQLVLVGEAKTRPINQRDLDSARNLLGHLKDTQPFLMLADPKIINVYRLEPGNRLSDPLLSLKTEDVLKHYEPEFGQKPVFHDYLVTLLAAWLRDIAYHWKSPNPPGAAEIRSSGLLQKLEGGTTVSDPTVLRANLLGLR